MKLIEYIFEFDDLTNAKEIVFFGGSFNPWHEGHTTCIQLLSPHLPVVIIPDHNPFKDVVLDNDKLTSPASIIQRVQHLNRNIFIYDGFLKLNQQNPTYKWIREVKEQLPMTKLSLLLGYDNFKSMHEWNEIKSLLADLKTIYVASRLENDREHAVVIQRLKDINPSLTIELLGHHKYEHLSSTEFRSKK